VTSSQEAFDHPAAHIAQANVSNGCHSFSYSLRARFLKAIYLPGNSF
jgi:hypothetical protein